MTLTTISRLVYATLATWILVCGAAFAACPSDQEVAVRAAGYLSNQSLDGYGDTLSLADAYCAQAKYVARIAEGYGEVIGYKVGFTGKATQERFKIPGPAMGVLLSKMIIANGSTIAPDFGFRTLVEPDMVVTVKDAGIMNATNELQVRVLCPMGNVI
jgi:2-oxo-hept-3-ene-1,7-dioate hydratase